MKNHCHQRHHPQRGPDIAFYDETFVPEHCAFSV
jgi:hypothetical protein